VASDVGGIGLRLTGRIVLLCLWLAAQSAGDAQADASQSSGDAHSAGATNPDKGSVGLGWTQLEPGLELGAFGSPIDSVRIADPVRVLRVDLERFAPRLLTVSSGLEQVPVPAAEWCARHDLVAAINASMFQEDYRTSVSLMKTGEHVNNARLSKDRAMLAFDPLADGLPAAAMLDRECDAFEAARSRYGSLVQSIRMLACDGRNVWRLQEKKYSTAAVGMDRSGRLIFVHVVAPMRTHDLINVLRELPLALDRLMYTEGGLQAQMAVRSRGGTFEFDGVPGVEYGTMASVGWPIPNVIGVVRR